jgi:hypothetical protein
MPRRSVASATLTFDLSLNHISKGYRVATIQRYASPLLPEGAYLRGVQMSAIGGAGLADIRRSLLKVRF